MGRTALRWLVFGGIAVGFAFLTKMMQGLLLPAFALAYLVAGRSGLWSRIWHPARRRCREPVVSGGWYVLLVALGRPTPDRTSAEVRPTRCGSWLSDTTA